METKINNNYVIADVTIESAKGIVKIYRDYWWWCVDGDPKKALFYLKWSSGQCNSNREVAEIVGERLGHDKYAKLIQIPIAATPWD